MFTAYTTEVLHLEQHSGTKTDPLALVHLFCRAMRLTPSRDVTPTRMRDRTLPPLAYQQPHAMGRLYPRVLQVSFPLLLPTVLAAAPLSYNYRDFNMIYQALLLAYHAENTALATPQMAFPEFVRRRRLTELLRRTLHTICRTLNDPMGCFYTDSTHLHAVFAPAVMQILPIYTAGGIVLDRDVVYAEPHNSNAIFAAVFDANLVCEWRHVQHCYFYNAATYHLNLNALPECVDAVRPIPQPPSET